MKQTPVTMLTALLVLSGHGVTFAVRDRLALDGPSRRLLDRFL